MTQKFQKQEQQKQIGQIRLSDYENLIVTIIDNERLDLRIWVETDKYKGPTKRGVRLYLWDGIWDEFKKLMEKVDKEVRELE